MPRRAHRCCALAIVLVLAIGHSAGLQTVAWVGMFIERVQTHSVHDALISILDGSRPCPLCKIARSWASAESAALRPDASIKGSWFKAPLKLSPPAPQFWLVAHADWSPPASGGKADYARPLDAALAAGFASEPPTPPPRPSRS